jgi:hypothetical protein
VRHEVVPGCHRKIDFTDQPKKQERFAASLHPIIESKEIRMTISNAKRLSAIALALAAAAGAAHAETYEGVHPLTTAESRANVAAGAVVAARIGNPYATGVDAGPMHPPVAMNNRDTVRAEAVAAARAPDPYAEAASSGTTPIVAGAVDRATVRAEAYAAARGNALPL